MTTKRDASGSGRGFGELARLAAGQLGLVKRSQARGARCSDAQLARLCRAGVLERARPGVYRWRAAPRSFEQDVLAACLSTSNAVACSLTAMTLLGFTPRRSSRDKAIHVVTGVARRQPAQPGVRVHRTRNVKEAGRRLVGSVPTTRPLRTLEDVAGELDWRDLERFIGYLIASKAVTPDQLGGLHRRLSGARATRRKGAGRLRRCLESAGMTARAESVLEHEALLCLRRAHLPEPVAQFRVPGARGEVIARLDLAWPEQKVCVEVDGYRWHADPASFARDRRRRNLLEALGWRIFHVTAGDVGSECRGVVKLLRMALDPVGDPVASKDVPEARASWARYSARSRAYRGCLTTARQSREDAA